MTLRLRRIRELEAATLHEAATWFGIPPSTYAAIERGARSLTFDPTEIGYSEDRLDRLVDMSSPMHRQRSAVRAKAQRSNRELLRLGGEVFAELAKSQPKAPIVGISRLPEPTSDLDVESFAEEARFMLDLSPEEPISNMTSAIERAGIALIPVYDDGLEVRHAVDGLSAWVEDQPTIAVNPQRPGDRFRLTLGHELGHLVMHRKPHENVEHEASLFASCLLIPTPCFLDEVGPSPSLQDFIRLKRTWGLSIAAGIYRAHYHGVLSAERYRSLQMQTSRWRKQEPASFATRFGKLLPKLIERQGGMSQVANHLGVPPKHLSLLTAWERPLLRTIEGNPDEDEHVPIEEESVRTELRIV